MMQWKQGWAVGKRREKMPHQEVQKNWSSSQHTPPWVFIHQARGWHWEHIPNKHLGFSSHRGWYHTHSMNLQADNHWHRESSVPALAPRMPHHRFCPIRATLPVLCVTTDEITLLAAAVLCRIPPILTWCIFKLPCTELHNLLKKKKNQYFYLLFQQHSQPFPFPNLFWLLSAVSATGVFIHVFPSFQIPFLGQLIPQLLQLLITHILWTTTTPTGMSTSVHSTQKWKNSFLRRNECRRSRNQ